MQLSLELVAIILSLLTLVLSFCCVAVGAFQAYTGVLMKLEVANLRTEQSTQLSNMRTEIQSYMNGSFMRSKEVEAHFAGYEKRLSAVEHTEAAHPPQKGESQKG